MASLPRHAINRLAALHLVSGMLDSFADPVASFLDANERGKAAVIASRIAMSVARAKLLDPHDKSDSRLVNTILRRNDAMCAKLDREIDARIALAMVMGIVAREEEAIPREHKWIDKRWEWGTLHTLIGEFYDILDKGLSDSTPIDVGSAAADSMVAA